MPISRIAASKRDKTGDLRRLGRRLFVSRALLLGEEDRTASRRLSTSSGYRRLREPLLPRRPKRSPSVQVFLQHAGRRQVVYPLLHSPLAPCGAAAGARPSLLIVARRASQTGGQALVPLYETRD